MFDFNLAEGLSPIADIPHSLAMRDNVLTTTTDSNVALVYYRFEDEPDKEPQFLKEVPAGQSADFPIDLQGRPIRFFAVSKTKTGVPSVKTIFEGRQYLFDPGAQIIAGEDILTNQLLHYYDDAGVTKAELADASDATKPCQAFAANDALTGEFVRPLGAASDITGLTGKTPGTAQYLSTTPGEMTESPAADPVTDIGKLVQKVGTALSPTSVDFNPETGAPVIATGGDTPYPPSGLIASDGGPDGGLNEFVGLNWTNNGGTGDNVIERREHPAGFIEIDTVAFNVATYTDSLVLGSTVTYRIRNASVLGYSNPSPITV